jgi:hypothetical protein
MLIKKLSGIVLIAGVVCGAVGDVIAAPAKVSKQNAIQTGTKVRTKVAVTGLYDQECYDAYYGCMDQFCISDNESGGSCACSDLNAGYEKEFLEIKDILDKAEYVRTVEVEKVQAGANADILFAGNRRYDEDGNILAVGELTEAEKKKQKRESLMALFETNYDEDEDVFSDEDEMEIFNKTGNALHKAAEQLCLQQIPEHCDGDVTFLRQVYGRQITSDCKGFKNSLDSKRAEAEAALAKAEADVRSALRDSLNEANKYDLGTCMVEFKKCMMTEDACGKDWSGCVSTIADANMQGTKESKVFKSDNMKASAQKAYEGSTYGIAASTMEGLDSKRLICERVLDNCVAVRNQVWPAFLREAAPTIKVAELSVESKMRQSCLTDISDCIQKACKDDIAGKGVATMDACLARPDMARSFCKIQVDRCEKMEPQIWAYVTDKLKAMRVDVCTNEVKECFTADNRCGKNFEKCIGMDYDYIHDICPIDSLVVCKQANPNFSMDDLDSMLMGLYLNIDNAAMDNCQDIVDRKMAEVCGSTTDCNRFAADDVLGTGSLRSQKLGTKYRVTGMISFGSIKMGDAVGMTTDGAGDILAPGEIGVQDYLAKIIEKNTNVPNKDGIISAIEEELNNIAGTINRTIQMIEQDPEIQFCVNGRDLSQITGEKGAKTVARFPNLLNSIKMQIAAAALRQAQDNYNKKFTESVAQATKDASADLAQYMCQKMAEQSATTLTTADTVLAEPYAISYDVGSGLSSIDLTAGGYSKANLGEVSFKNDGYLGKVNSDLSAGTKETKAIFNRETRICHICTTTIVQSCKTTGSKSWFHNNRNMECTVGEPIEKCEDIPM